MAKNLVLEWDTTASNNTDIGGTGILGTNAVSNFDDAFRTAMAQVASGIVTRFTSRAAGYTAVKADYGQASFFTAAATLSLTAAATLTAGWQHWVYANAGDVVIDPNSAETINGVATVTVPSGQSALIRCNGTAFYAQIFGSAVSGAGVQGFLTGLTLSNNGSDATNDIDIATGAAAADTSPYAVMTLASTLTKRLDAAWAVGSGNGGLDTGSIANTTYHVWLIQRSDTGVVDALFSTSATSPTMPSNYDRKRRIGSIIRASAAIKLFTQNGDDFAWVAPPNDRSSTAAANNVLLTITVPTGIKVAPWLYETILGNAGSTARAAYGNGDATTAENRVVNMTGAVFGSGAFSRGVYTNTSAQIRYLLEITGSIAAQATYTNGYTDTRGRI